MWVIMSGINQVIFQILLIMGIVRAALFYPDIRLTGVRVDDEYVCQGIGGQCSSDCKTLFSCNSIGGPPIAEYPCTGDTPYCIINQCAAVISNDCELATDPTPTTTTLPTKTTKNPAIGDASKFICTGEGLYPDPDTCNQYYACDANDIAALYTCGSGSYDATVRACIFESRLGPRTSKTASKCTSMTCPKSLPGYAVHKPNPAYYMYCDLKDIRIVARCADEENTKFDLTKEECLFVCKKAGDFADLTNCNKFYRCTKVGSIFRVTHNTCAKNNYFADTKCVKEVGGPCVSQIK